MGFCHSLLPIKKTVFPIAYLISMTKTVGKETETLCEEELISRIISHTSTEEF
jgi:hypothetical protein